MEAMGRLRPEDDLRHDISGSDHGRESLFWVLPLPAHDLLLLNYAWINADGTCGRFVALAGKDPANPHVLDMQDGIPLGGDDFGDCDFGGLKVRLPELMKRSELSYAGDNLSFDLAFDAIHEPFSYHDNPDGCPSWLADDRFEQSLTVKGTLNADGREIEIDTTAHRDHSWGNRDWEVLHHWKWINAQDGSDTTVNAYTNVLLGDLTVNGYLYKAGLLSPLVEVDVRTEFGPAFVQHGIEATFVDAEGRRAELKGRINTGMHLDFGPIFVNETGCTGELDGRPVPYLFECGWEPGYIKRLMSREEST